MIYYYCTIKETLKNSSLKWIHIIDIALFYFLFSVKPNITPFSPDTLDTEETASLNVLCHSNGSRPTAFIHWLLGQHHSNVSSNSSTKYMHDSSTDTYTVTSTLKYRVDRIYNGQKLTCKAVNVAGSMETSLTLYVKCKTTYTGSMKYVY